MSMGSLGISGLRRWSRSQDVDRTLLNAKGVRPPLEKYLWYSDPRIRATPRCAEYLTEASVVSMRRRTAGVPQKYINTLVNQAVDTCRAGLFTSISHSSLRQHRHPHNHETRPRIRSPRRYLIHPLHAAAKLAGESERCANLLLLRARSTRVRSILSSFVPSIPRGGPDGIVKKASLPFWDAASFDAGAPFINSILGQLRQNTGRT